MADIKGYGSGTIRPLFRFVLLAATFHALLWHMAAHASTPISGDGLVRLRFDVRLDDSLDENDAILSPQQCPNIGMLHRMVSVIRRSSRLLYTGTGKRAVIDHVRIFLPFHWPRDNLPGNALQCAGEADLGNHAVTMVSGSKMAGDVCGEAGDFVFVAHDDEHPGSGNHSMDKQTLRVPLSLITNCNVSTM